jgi:hypothetical protein
VVDFPHVLHMLLVRDCVVSRILALDLRNVISVLFDVSFGKLRVLILPEEGFHLVEVFLNFKQFEEFQQKFHNHPNSWSILARYHVLCPAKEE